MEQETQKIKLRKVYVLREVETFLGDIKTGDVFRMEAASTEDTFVNSNQWQFAMETAEPIEPEGNARVECYAVDLVPKSEYTDHYGGLVMKFNFKGTPNV